MELKQPPDIAPLLQSGPASPVDAYLVGPRKLRAGGRGDLRALAAVVVVFCGLFGGLFGGLRWAHRVESSGVHARPTSYLLAARASLVFVQWHQRTSAGAVTGTITFANLAGKPPAETVALESTPFTGHLYSGSSQTNYDPWISLRVNDLSNYMSGYFQNGKLALDVPNQSGVQFSTYILVRSDHAAYNAALRTLTVQEQRANQMAAARRQRDGAREHVHASS
jgi:hypothetical protein